MRARCGALTEPGSLPSAARVRTQRTSSPAASASPTSRPTRLLFWRKPNIDAVLVDAPDDLHRDLTLRALAAGKHVLCEKPLADTVQECAEMVAAAESAAGLAMVGFSNRRFPWAQEAKRLIDTGMLGRIFHVHAQSLSASMLKPDAKRRWRSDPRRAPLGVLGDLGSHTFDLLRFLFGEVIEVCADMRSLSDLPGAQRRLRRAHPRQRRYPRHACVQQIVVRGSPVWTWPATPPDQWRPGRIRL